MAHEYFNEVDFENLPTFAMATELVSEEERYLAKLCDRLKKIMESYKEPSA